MHQIKMPLKQKCWIKMKQPSEIRIKLKLMFTSYAELLNGSIMKKVMRTFRSPQKEKLPQTFPHNFYSVLCGKIFFHFITVPT